MMVSLLLHNYLSTDPMYIHCVESDYGYKYVCTYVCTVYTVLVHTVEYDLYNHQWLHVQSFV